MKRRRFLQNLAAGAAGISCLPAALEPVAAGALYVNGRPGKASGPRSDTVGISPGQEKRFDIRAQYD